MQQRDVFDEIFKNLYFYRIRPGGEGYMMYAAQLQSFIGNAKRYVILFVQDRYAYYDKARINQLRWTSLQTRTIPDDYRIVEQMLDPKALDTRYHPKVRLYLKARTDKQTEYNAPMPIELALLHDPKRKTKYQYGDEMTLRQALATFQCVIKKLDYI